MSGYWTYPGNSRVKRSEVIDTPKPGWFIRLLMLLIYGAVWSETSTNDRR